MRSLRLRGAIVSMAAIVCTSCSGHGGSPTKGDVAIATTTIAPSTIAPTTTMTSPIASAGPTSSVGAVPASAPGPIVTESRDDTNDSSTPMDLLCWTRREVVLSLADELRTSAAAPSARFLEAARRAAAITVEALPVDVRPFAARFRSDASAAAAVGGLAAERIARFDFEQYPGVQAYLAAARVDPACPQP